MAEQRVRIIITPNDGKNGIDPRGPMTARQWASFGKPRPTPRPIRWVPQDDATSPRPTGWTRTSWLR